MADKIKLTFLGTGAMVPDEKRNHPAIFLQHQAENILVDCGEGTQVQFRKAKLNPCKITRILITHWHGDHTFGLPGLLRTLETSGYNKTLYIYGPKGFKKHMEEMFVAFGGIGEFEIKIEEVSGKFFENRDFYLEAEKMVHVQPCNSYNFVLKGHSRIDKKKMKKLKLPEGKHIQQIKQGKDVVVNGKKFKAKDFLVGEENKKISFVLDTVINGNIVKFAKDADILVCESTFGKDHEDLAKNYQHLTSVQAGQIAKKANVKNLYLIHVSQRYNKDIKKIGSEARKYFSKVFLPNDLDSVML